MLFASKLSPEHWAEARRLRAEGATLTAIAARFGVNLTTIGVRARKEGWASPTATPGATASARTAKTSSQPVATVGIRRRLTHRLYNIMDLKLELMELRMHKQLKDAKKAIKQDGAEIPAGDEEKDTRHLATFIKTIDQATELDPDRARDADGGATNRDAEARASEADAFRREIAQRIEKLVPPS